jgi:FkbM family methyltransferase
MLKVIAKNILWLVFTMVGFGRDFVPIVYGPLFGKKMLKEHGLRNLSTLIGRYEPSFTNAFLRESKSAPVIYDIGSNIGYFSLLAALNKNSKIYSFEPVPKVAEQFRLLMGLNGLSEKVKLSEVALSNELGKIKMVTPGAHEQGLMVSALRGQKVDIDDSILVDMTTLDHLVFEENFPPPDLIKLDVEGAEAMVLDGGERTLMYHKPRLLIEVHGLEPAEKCWSIFERCHAVVYCVDQNGEFKIADRCQWMTIFDDFKWKVVHAKVIIP